MTSQFPVTADRDQDVDGRAVYGSAASKSGRLLLFSVVCSSGQTKTNDNSIYIHTRTSTQLTMFLFTFHANDVMTQFRLVANSVHTTDADRTRQNSFVVSESVM